MKEQLKTSKVEKFLSSNRTKNLLQQTKTHLTHTKHTTVEKKKEKTRKTNKQKRKEQVYIIFRVRYGWERQDHWFPSVAVCAVP